MARGPKLVEMDRAEIRHAVKDFHVRLPNARAVILMIQDRQGNNWITSTCTDKWQTVTMLESAKAAYIK
jgi:hypothetical protein